MTKEFLLDAIGDAKGSNIWQAQQLRISETASAGSKQSINTQKLWNQTAGPVDHRLRGGLCPDPYECGTAQQRNGAAKF